MIITRQKSQEDILSALADAEKVFITGCSECATLCRTGGEAEILKMKEFLESNGKIVTGYRILEPACHLQNDKKVLKENKEELERSGRILVLSCGNGVQTVAEATGKEVVSGNDTLFLGSIKRLGEFERTCTMCGDCHLNETGGLCAVTRCPKHMLNGPCGGCEDGKCEVDPEASCIWFETYSRLKERGKLDLLKKIQPPKDWSKGDMRALKKEKGK